jgi:hypothetical protein
MLVKVKILIKVVLMVALLMMRILNTAMLVRKIRKTTNLGLRYWMEVIPLLIILIMMITGEITILPLPILATVALGWSEIIRIMVLVEKILIMDYIIHTQI